MSQIPDDLGQKIKEAQSKSAPPPRPKEAHMSPEMQAALKAATDFSAAIVVGAFLGYWIDRWFGTSPYGIVIFIFLGFGAGILNLYRTQVAQNDKKK